ncbi:MAG: hypothetical protein CMF75_06385 [Maricaulis sp.]|nr:hypothetical protein [Maricaulis sp.]
MTVRDFWLRDGMGRLEDKSNNFTAMRILFALMVLYAHALIIPQGLPYVGAWQVTADFLVNCALDGFFILSGYMITASAMKATSLTGYAASRIFRIYPGLIASVLVVMIATMFFTTLSPAEYWTHAETWLFPVKLLSQADPLASLPGAFEGLPTAYRANAPLWTIRFELLAYLGVGLLLALGLYKHKLLVLFWALAACAGGALIIQFGYSGPGDDTIQTMSRFAPAFMIGAAFHAGREHLRLSPAFIILTLAAALASSHLAIGGIMKDVFLAALFIWMGHQHIPGRAGEAVRNVEDISYGIYIMHWPLGQMLMVSFPSMNTTVLALAMFLAVLPVAWLMRVLVESPSLALKSKLFPRKRVDISKAAVPA